MWQDGPAGTGNIESVGGILSDFGCPQAQTVSRISLVTWWNSKNQVLMFPIPGSDHDETLLSFQFDAEVCSLSQAGFAKNSNGSANAFFV